MLISLEGGRTPQVDESAFVAPNATLVGSVEIGAGASVWYGAVLRADNEPIVIGPRSNVQDNCAFHVDQGRPLTLGEARVRGQILVADDQGSGSREVHVFRGLVRPGNSGGALLGLDGSVIGLVFANAQDDDQTGFALTEAEVRPAIKAASSATTEVSSGACRVL